MSFRSIGGNEWRDLGTTGQGRSGPAETKGFPTMHSNAMYGKVEHEGNYGRRSGGFQVLQSLSTTATDRVNSILHDAHGCCEAQLLSLQGSGMGHIGGGGIDGFSQQPTVRRSIKQKMTSTQDPDINLSPLMKRSDSFSSFSGKQTGFNSSKKNLGARQNGDSQIICKKEAFYVVEVRARLA